MSNTEISQELLDRVKTVIEQLNIESFEEFQVMCEMIVKTPHYMPDRDRELMSIIKDVCLLDSEEIKKIWDMARESREIEEIRKEVVEQNENFRETNEGETGTGNEAEEAGGRKPSIEERVTRIEETIKAIFERLARIEKEIRSAGKAGMRYSTWASRSMYRRYGNYRSWKQKFRGKGYGYKQDSYPARQYGYGKNKAYKLSYRKRKGYKKS